ncbi:unnamed protein product [Oncorhynchus mykiss]|uniref:C2H2-type domain-containing protein n=1 Tax=Oncorhynchus mykiss TaxID=8022 RepID=A0A060ZAC7_ONCMY|nr:unnamed protein product [Oncorhynchus mykiss]
MLFSLCPSPQQEVTDVPLSTIPGENSITNGEVEEVTDNSIMETSPKDMTMVAGDAVAIETTEMSVGEGVGVVAPVGQQVKERLVGGHPCAQCDRVFMSMQGLRSHERSHSAMAMFTREDKYSCQYCQFVSPFRHNLDRHVQSHHGHHKPFRCKLCPFKSAYLSRLKSHLHKAHAGRKQPQHTSLSSIRLPETDSVHGGVRNRTLFPTHPRKEILYYTMV